MPRHAKPASPAAEEDLGLAFSDTPTILAPLARQWAARDDLGRMTVAGLANRVPLRQAPRAADDTVPLPWMAGGSVTRPDLMKVAEAIGGA